MQHRDPNLIDALSQRLEPSLSFQHPPAGKTAMLRIRCSLGRGFGALEVTLRLCDGLLKLFLPLRNQTTLMPDAGLGEGDLNEVLNGGTAVEVVREVGLLLQRAR